MSSDLNNYPIYQKIKDDIVVKIKDGLLAEGEKIKSERELCIIYGVSRMTARKALEELELEGYAKRIIGKGTYVNKKKINRDFHTLTGMTEHLKSSGISNVRVKVIQKKVIYADERISKKLKISLGEEVYYIARLRFVDDIPVSYEKEYIPVLGFEGLIDYDLEKLSLFKIINDKYNTLICNTTNLISLGYASSETANLLKKELKDPLFKIEEFHYDLENRVVEYTRSYNDAKLFTYVCKSSNEIFREGR